MTDRYPHVLNPIRIGPIEVKNRLYAPPHGLNFLVAGGSHGSLVPSDDYAYYLAERAAAGVGLLFHPLTTLPRVRTSSPLYEASIPHFRAVAELVHRNGAKLMAQLHGREGGVPWEPLGGFVPSTGPSDYQLFDGHDTAREMSVAEIAEWVRAHGRCARNLRDASYDGIEVQAAHGALMANFLSPYFNSRRDGYGGALVGRMRILVETLEEIRRNVSAAMAVGLRLNCDEMLPGGSTQDDAKEILGRLVGFGLIDFVDLDIAVEPQQTPFNVASQFMEPLHMVGFSSAVGQAVKGKIVVMGPPGRLTTVAQADRLIAEGALDMVGAVRELIAEPELLKNALEGREDRSRTCIACNFCLNVGAPRIGRPGSWGCVINPATGRERRWGVRTFAPTPTPVTVVIAGGGPAGMEAARVAARLGHRVTLFERRSEVGGQLALWARLPGRDVLCTTVEWYRRQLDELGVRVRTGQDASAALVLAERPDAVIVATGARYVPSGESGFMRAAIPGAAQDFVYTPEMLLEGGARPSGGVLILDEERMHTGVGLAQLLAEAGAQVELVSRDLMLVGAPIMYSLEFPFVVPKLKSLGVRLTNATYVKEIGDHTVTLFDILTNEEEVRAVDAVVLATMRRSDPELAKALEGQVAQLYVIGDALGARMLFDATYEGQRFARLIGVDGAPRTTSEALFAPMGPEVFAKPAGTLLTA